MARVIWGEKGLHGAEECEWGSLQGAAAEDAFSYGPREVSVRGLRAESKTK